MGKPLYGDVFGTQTEEISAIADNEVYDKTQWGELESESESEEESEDEEEEEDQTGVVTPGDVYAFNLFFMSQFIQLPFK